MANETKPHIDERLTRVLIDALLAADDGAALNALRAARRIIEGQGADAHRLIISLRGESPPASHPFKTNRRDVMQQMWDRARKYVRSSPDPWGKKAKLEELLSRHLSAQFTTGGARVMAVIDAELEALLAELDNLAQSPPAQT
jgi:hypothetical protein